MYNAALWTVTDTLAKQIASFQRKLLRHTLSIKYSRVITNIELLQITKQTPWSAIIAKQRMQWYGHCKRLPEDSPAKQALAEYERQVQKPRGRPAMTWLEIVKKQIINRGLSIEEAELLTEDRVGWRRFIN